MLANEDQKRAIESSSRAVLVIASAGTGKTRVLTERIIHLVEGEKINPENILAITFTNLAAEEMKHRVWKKLKDSYKIPTSIGTIHSLFGQILRRDIEKICSWRDHNFEVIQEENKIGILREAFRTVKKDTSTTIHKLRKIKELLSLWKMGRFLNRPKLNELDRIRYEEIFLEYERILMDRNFLDFDDVLIFCFNLLDRYPSIRDFWVKKYRAILVDECQDLNEIQWLLICKLIDKSTTRSFFAVGDPNQCIYIFGGAKEDIFDDIRSFFPDIETIELSINYRSSRKIVEYSNQIKKIKTRDSISGRPEEGEIILLKSILEIPDVIKEPWNNWAILFPKHSNADAILEPLMDKHIPFKVSKSSLMEDLDIEKIVRFLKVTYFDSSCPLKYLIYSREMGFSPHARKNITTFENLPKDITLLNYLLESDTYEYFDINPTDTKTLRKFSETLKTFRSLPKDDLLHVVREIVKYLFPNLEEDKILSKKVNQFIKFLRELSHIPAEEVVLNLKSYAELSKEEIVKKKHDSVTLSTIHKTKGLEWENVIILENEYLSIGSVETVEDKHLAYVAYTRAKNKLYLVS